MRKGYIEGEKVGKRRVDDLKYLYKTSVFLWRLKKKKNIQYTATGYKNQIFICFSE